MRQTPLDVRKRIKGGKEFCKKIRRSGWIPGVLYGKGIKPILLEVDERQIEKILSSEFGQNVILNLKVAVNGFSESYLAMIADIQRDIFQKSMLHIDFHRISLDEMVRVRVPVELAGEVAGVKDGGTLEHVLWEVEVEALPLNLPEHIEVDISSLGIGSSFHVKDIVLPDGVKILGDLEEVVAILHPPKVVVVEEAAPAPAAPVRAAEPEVIKKGKEEE